jgi:hypothetical protein
MKLFYIGQRGGDDRNVREDPDQLGLAAHAYLPQDGAQLGPQGRDLNSGICGNLAQSFPCQERCREPALPVTSQRIQPGPSRRECARPGRQQGSLLGAVQRPRALPRAAPQSKYSPPDHRACRPARSACSRECKRRRLHQKPRLPVAAPPASSPVRATPRKCARLRELKDRGACVARELYRQGLLSLTLPSYSMIGINR